MQEREREGGGLPRTGGRLGQHIATGQERGDRGALDRGRLLVAECGQRVEDARIKGEVVEP
jgi:hypothetical protein